MQPAGANAQQQLPKSPALRAGQALPVTGQPMARYINVANIDRYLPVMVWTNQIYLF